MYDYVILTAAITRPDLHSQLVPGFLEFIGTASVKWLVNVDRVQTVPSVEETIDAFQRSIAAASNVDLEFLPAAGGGCFFSAARRLALRAHELMPLCRTGVVWLEDDWSYTGNRPITAVLRDLRVRLARNRLGGAVLRCPGTLHQKQSELEDHEARGHSLWFVSLVPRSRVSFNPGIWSKALFERGIRTRLAEHPPDQIDDPESLCADPFNEDQSYRDLSVFVDPVFQDAGRLWSVRNGLVKWTKSNAVLQRRGSVTYQSNSLERSRDGDHGVEELTGYFVCAYPFANTPLRWIGSMRPTPDGSRVTLVAVPFLSFVVQPVAPRQADVYMNRFNAWARTYPVKKLPARLSWHRMSPSSEGQLLEIDAPAGVFEAVLTSMFPFRWAWLIPIQALVGLVAYCADAIKVITRLESDRLS